MVKASKASSNRQAIIEKYIDGIDTTCFCWAHKGQALILTWWDELVGIGADDRITGIGGSVPSVISDTNVQRKAEGLVK